MQFSELLNLKKEIGVKKFKEIQMKKSKKENDLDLVEESENEFGFGSDSSSSHDDSSQNESDNSSHDESDISSHDESDRDTMGNQKVSQKSRKNKNAPAELSSKKSVSRKRVVVQVKNAANKVST